VEALTRFAGREAVRTARLQGIGAFSDAVLGFYDRDRKEYKRIPVEDETEVLALLGNLTTMDQGPRVHAHATLSRRDGSALGGHLFEGRVGATLEVFILEVPGEVHREADEEIGLPLMRL
jgi:uncharacterized protein